MIMTSGSHTKQKANKLFFENKEGMKVLPDAIKEKYFFFFNHAGKGKFLIKMYYNMLTNLQVRRFRKFTCFLYVNGL